MSKFKCQIKSEAQMTKRVKAKVYLSFLALSIDLKFGFWHLGFGI